MTRFFSCRIFRPTSLALAILATPLAQAADDVIARVGDQEIKASQVIPYLANLSESDRAALVKNPASLSQAVRTLILQQALFKEAISSGWDKTPEVAAQLDRLRQEAIAETYLQSIAKVPEGYPSDEEVKRVYEVRKADLQVPAQIRLAQIYIAIPKDAPKEAQDQAKTRIDEISKAVKADDFAAVAREKSQERESASRGGEVGWLAEPQIQPEIRSKVASLPKGAITEPVRLADGWYVVKVLDVREAHAATLDEVKGQLVRLLRNERARANREAYLSRLQQQTPIALDELGLSKLLQISK
ncbi:MAG: peptidylprolyl isomerase [Verrucomicrobiota bacterium]